MTSKYSITHIRKVVKNKSGNECSVYGLGLYENSAEFYEYCQNKYEAKAEKVKNRIIHKNYKAINNLCENYFTLHTIKASHISVCNIETSSSYCHIQPASAPHSLTKTSAGVW